MDPGDIVLDELGNRYLVSQVHANDAVTLVRRESPPITTSSSNPTYRVEANPYRDWPFLVLPSKFGTKGHLREVGLPDLSGRSRPLVEMQHWLLGVPSRNGGALYLSPSLGLRYPQRVLLTYEKERTSVIVPRTFLAVGQKAAAAVMSRVAPEEAPPTVYDHLMGDDEE